MSGWIYTILFATGGVAGFVDSIAGGGGLITIPVLLSLGLPPQITLGTNKLQASFGSGSAMWHYAEAGAVKLSECVSGIIFTCIGALLGAFAVQQISPSLLKKAIPFLLIGLCAYTLLRPKLGTEDARPRMKPRAFAILFGLVIGFYDGFLGPGTGSFWTMAYMLLLGFNMTKATAHTKVMNFTSNIASLALFLVGGHVLFLPGVVMGAGQLLGARLGAKAVLKRGTGFIRPVFVAVAFVMTLKLLVDAYF